VSNSPAGAAEIQRNRQRVFRRIGSEQSRRHRPAGDKHWRAANPRQHAQRDEGGEILGEAGQRQRGRGHHHAGLEQARRPDGS